jgi:hypothetical protein
MKYQALSWRQRWRWPAVAPSGDTASQQRASIQNTQRNAEQTLLLSTRKPVAISSTPMAMPYLPATAAKFWY